MVASLLRLLEVVSFRPGPLLIKTRSWKKLNSVYVWA